MEQKPRQIAVRILKERLAGSEFTEALFERHISATRLSTSDRALCQELVYGVVRWQMTLDWLISRRTEGRDQKDVLRILLQLGLYQLFWLSRIPDHAAVNETVDLARQLGFGPQSGFVNAILRKYIRERAETEKELAQLKVSQPHLGWSHPEWLYQRWLHRFGAESTARLMAWNNTPAVTFARVNRLKTDAARLTAQWEAEGVKFTKCSTPWVEEGLVFQLNSHPALAGMKSFQEGSFYVQDPSTLLAVAELDPQAGENIADLCAAPGGKTTFIAQRMQNRGRVVARDAQPARMALVQENCARLGVTCVQSAEGDAADQAELFDRVLVDAPCSNTGVMRRRIDLRWRLGEGEIQRLAAMQLDLLGKASRSVKPGGVLVYSTCSLEPEENGGVVRRFLAENPQFRLESERELLPFVDGVDGAYVAKLVAKQPD